MYSVTVKCNVDLSSITSESSIAQQHTETLATVPSLEDLMNQIQKEIPQLTEDGAKKLAETAHKELMAINHWKPVGKFAGCFKDAKPHICVNSWKDFFTMFNRMTYPADYGGGLHLVPEIKADDISFWLVTVPNTKEVVINYIEKD